MRSWSDRLAMSGTLYPLPLSLSKGKPSAIASPKVRQACPEFTEGLAMSANLIPSPLGSEKKVQETWVSWRGLQGVPRLCLKTVLSLRGVLPRKDDVAISSNLRLLRFARNDGGKETF